MGLQSKRTAAPAVRDVLQKHFIRGQSLRRLATLITVVKSAARQFRQNHPRAVLVVRVQHFTLGQSSNNFIGGGFATTDFFNDTNNLEWKHQQQ